MRDWFGFRRRREQFRAEVLAAVYPSPATPLDILRRVEDKRGRMVGVVGVVTALHRLTDEGVIRRVVDDNDVYYLAEPMKPKVGQGLRASVAAGEAQAEGRTL